MSVGEMVARFVVDTTYDTVPGAAIARAKDCLVDTLGAALAGGRVRASRSALSVVLDDRGTEAATVLGVPQRVSLPRAAFANAVLASALDFDDGHYWSLSHPGAVVIPAALAAAEVRKRSGRDLLAAIVVGYEVAIHAGAILNAKQRCRLYGSGASGAYGAAAAVAKLLGCDAETVGHALGIARCHMPVSTVMDSVAHGAMTKESIGWGAFTGTWAALLAEKGFTGPANNFDEPHHASESDVQPLTELGKQYRITDVYFKVFPSCLWTHAAVAAALQLRREYQLTAQDIAEVTVWTHQRAVSINDPAPASIEAAQYSVPFTVAAALLDGELAVSQMHEERLGDQGVLDLASRVRLILDARMDDMFPARRPARVVIRTRHGAEYEREVLVIKGSGEDPFTPDEVDAKFLRLATPALGGSRARQLLEVLRQVEEHRDVSTLSGLLSQSHAEGNNSATR